MPGISAYVPREKWRRGEKTKLGSCLTETSSEKPEFCLEINHSVFIIFFPKNLIFPIGSQANVSESEIKSNCVRKELSLHPSWETKATRISSRVLFPFSSRGLCFAVTPAAAQMCVQYIYAPVHFPTFHLQRFPCSWVVNMWDNGRSLQCWSSWYTEMFSRLKAICCRNFFPHLFRRRDCLKLLFLPASRSVGGLNRLALAPQPIALAQGWFPLKKLKPLEQVVVILTQKTLAIPGDLETEEVNRVCQWENTSNCKGDVKKSQHIS